MEAMKYLIVIEKTNTGYSAYSPDLDGCVTTGATLEEVERNMREAIELHLEGMLEEGYPIPQPHTLARYVDVAAWRYSSPSPCAAAPPCRAARARLSASSCSRIWSSDRSSGQP